MPELRVKDQANLNQLAAHFGVVVKPNTPVSLHGVPIVIDPHVMDGFAVLIDVCNRCMPTKTPATCSHCMGVRQMVVNILVIPS